MDIPNLCMDCGVDMGNCNPRQLCGKWKCLNEAFIDLSDTEDETTTEQTNSTNNDTKTNAEYCEEPETKKAKTNDE